MFLSRSRLDDAAFDAVFSNDVLCHVRGRLPLLREIFRVLKPGGRFLFSDALVIGGMISHEEVAARSAIGYYLFSPPGENERLLQDAGFARIEVMDTTASAAEISERWHNAREKHGEALAAIEGAGEFRGAAEVSGNGRKTQPRAQAVATSLRCRKTWQLNLPHRNWLLRFRRFPSTRLPPLRTPNCRPSTAVWLFRQNGFARMRRCNRRGGRRLSRSLGVAIVRGIPPIHLRHDTATDRLRSRYFTAIFISESSSESESQCGFNPRSISFECFAL